MRRHSNGNIYEGSILSDYSGATARTLDELSDKTSDFPGLLALVDEFLGDVGNIVSDENLFDISLRRYSQIRTPSFYANLHLFSTIIDYTHFPDPISNATYTKLFSHWVGG